MINNLLAAQLNSRKSANQPSAITISTFYAYSTMLGISYTLPAFFPTGLSCFKIYRDGALTDTIYAFNTTWHDYTVSPNTTYSYKIRAYDLNGQYSESNTLTITTGDGTAPVVWDFGVGTDALSIYPGCMCSAVNLIYMGYVHCYRPSTNTHHYEYDYTKAGLTSGSFNFEINKATLGAGTWEISMLVRDYNMNDTLTSSISLTW